MDKVLGLNLQASKSETVEIPEEVEKLLGARARAREAKEWEAADKLRDEIAAHGFTVKDTPNGQELLSTI